MAFVGTYDSRLRPALNALDETSRMLGTKSGIQMYKIAVVGDQSSGKSSLIESMFSFSLPRGGGIVTRTPIQVEHRYTADNEHAVISYQRYRDDEEFVKVKITDLEKIEEEVRKATKAVAGEGKAVVDTPIYLRVYTSRLPDLTVVDLPGITRNAAEGQPDNIEEIVTDIIETNIKGDMTVILCVLQATVDFSTAAAIKLARKHDPAGERTMCVVTKIDLTELGQDMLNCLQGGASALKLKMGLIPVRNRTAKELADGTPLDAVRANEAAFFNSHPQLKHLPKDRRGIQSLVEELARVQMQCIVKCLPDVKKQVREKLDEHRKELSSLQDTVVSSESEAQMRLHQLCTKLDSKLLLLCQGFYKDLKAGQEELKVPRRIHDMAEDYRKEVEEACCLPWFLSDECFELLREQSKDARGVALPNFLHSNAFLSVYTSRVQDQLLGPALDLVTRARAYMEEQVLFGLMGEVLRPFPRLLAAARDQGQELLREQEAHVRAHIELMIGQQRVVMTLNHYYVDTVNCLRGAALQMRETVRADGHLTDEKAAGFKKEYGEALFAFIQTMSESQSNEDQALREMQISLKAYSKVVLKRVVDNVALGARWLLVEQVADKLAGAIQQGLFRLSEQAQLQAAGGDSEGGEGEGEGKAYVRVVGGGGGRGAPKAGAARGALLELMQDPQQARRREELERMVGSLEKAWARLRNINIA